MRLDHLLSKDRLCGGGFLVVVVWAVDGSGPVGWLLSRKAGWLAGALVSCLCGGAGVVGCLVFGVEDTPAAAWFGWWWVSLCVLVCVWGWHAVGVLG